MFTMIKKLLGLPTEADKTVAKEAEAPYKVEAVTNNAETTIKYEDIKPKTVEMTPVVAEAPAPVVEAPAPVAEAAAKPAAKKKAPAAKKPAGAKKGGRKPKSQAQ
jgi:hypothetical protein